MDFLISATIKPYQIINWYGLIIKSILGQLLSCVQVWIKFNYCKLHFGVSGYIFQHMDRCTNTDKCKGDIYENCNHYWSIFWTRGRICNAVIEKYKDLDEIWLIARRKERLEKFASEHSEVKI